MKDANKIGEYGGYWSLKEISWQGFSSSGNRGGRNDKRFFKRKTNKKRQRVYAAEIQKALTDEE